MKNSLLRHTLTLSCLAATLAITPLSAQSIAPTGTETPSSTAPTGQAQDKSTLNNHAQGTANNQNATGGDNAERKSGSPAPTH